MSHGTGPAPAGPASRSTSPWSLLTVVTVLVSYVNLGLMNVVVALLIASVKASLVALFFMHLKSEDRLVWGFALVPIVFPRPHHLRHARRHDVALIPRGEDNSPYPHSRRRGRRCWAG